MTKLKESIFELAQGYLEDEKHFIVDVVISEGKGPKKVLVLLDGDEGVNIDDCANLSRSIGHEIEEKNLIEDAYRLEVSSPGLDHPLASDRQYKKNIGRTVKVTLNDGKSIKGELLAFDKENLTLGIEKGKKKEKTEEVIPMSTIKKTIIQISFK